MVKTDFNCSTIRYCSTNGGTVISVFEISLITQFLLPTPRVFSSACLCTKGEFIKCFKYSLYRSFWLNFNSETLTNRLNSSVVLTITGIPVVPTFVSNMSPYSGLQRLYSIQWSASETNLQFEKSKIPLLTSLTEINGTPDSTYFGLEWVPSVSLYKIVPSLQKHQLFGISNGISSSIQRSIPSNFS